MDRCYKAPIIISFVFVFIKDPFFEVYVQFREYASFVEAMSTLNNKVLVQKSAGGTLRETKIKVDFDRTAHLSYRKITQRQVRRACIEELKRYSEPEYTDEAMTKMNDEEKREILMRQLMRVQKRRMIVNLKSGKVRSQLASSQVEQKKHEHTLRTKLKTRLLKRLQCTRQEREAEAKALLVYVARLYRV